MAGGRSPDVVTAAPSGTSGLLQRVLDLVAALRRAGLGTTQSDAIDAVGALPHVDLLDRRQLREALAAVTVTAPTQRATFDELFDLYFPARVRPARDPDTEVVPAEGVPDGDALLDELLELLQHGDAAELRAAARAAVEGFGKVEGRDGGAAYFQYKVLRAVDLDRLLAQAMARAEQDEELTDLERRLLRDEFEARIQRFRDEVDTDIRRRSSEQRGVERVAQRLTRPPIEELDLFRLTAAEQAQLRAQIRPLARKLAARMSVKRRHGKAGRLDVRRTVRRSMSTGGVPFEPAFRPKRPHKPELFLLCDVSGSVASFARFTLSLVHSLQAQFASVRSFAFIDTLDEVTRLFDEADPVAATQRVISEARIVRADGHSDYGTSFERFRIDHARDVTPRSTIIVLGDARNNYRQANAWILRDLRERARRVYWLNPEPVQFWDTGDSIASSYAREIDDMVEVRNLRQLAEFVARVADRD